MSKTNDTKGKIVDAYAEWDDPHAFRVFLVREGEDGQPDLDNAKPMEAVHDFGDECESIEGRLYRAAFVKCAKDFVGVTALRGPIGWPKEGPAKRVAKAVKAELARIEKGEPCPTKGAVQLATMLVPKRKGGR